MSNLSLPGGFRLVVASFFLGLLAPGPTLALDPDRTLTQYVHTSWVKRDGLPVNAVINIEQTRDGYLWLATPDGLVRFDGVKFTWFHSGNTPGLDNNVVRALLEDSRGTLWVGGNSGLFRWAKGSLEEVFLADGSELAGVNLVVDDPQGRLWISYHGGIARLEDEVAEKYLFPDGTPSTRVTGLVIASDGSFWFAGAELIHVVEDTVYRIGGDEGLTDIPLTVHEDLQETIWVGLRQGGVARWNGNSLIPLEGTGGVSVADIQAEGETLWIASLGRGLMRHRSGEIEFLGSREGLTSDDVNSLLLDREGNLWFGSQGGGLNRLRTGAFATISTREGLPHQNVSAVFEDAAGTLWIGTSGGGLLSRTADRWRRWGRDEGLGSEAIITVSEDHQGRLWVGTGNAGVYWLDGDRFQRLRVDGLDPVSVVSSLVAAPGGGIWLGGFGGAFWSDGLKSKRLVEIPSERAWRTTHLLQGPEGAIWIGSVRSGLARVDNGTPEFFTTAEGLADNGALALHSDSSGALWIGTYGGGLQRRSDGKFATVRARDGLCEDVIYSILEDDFGALWLGGNRGVCRVDKAAVEAFLSDSGKRVESRLFGVDDGLLAGETNGGPNRSAFRSSDGRLWFATPDGAAWVDPQRIPPAQKSPPAIIEAVVCDGRSLTLDETGLTSDIPAGTQQCSIDYTATALTRPSEISFRYRLEGQSNSWIDMGAMRSVSLAGLGPGTHRFQVESVDRSGLQGRPAEVSFRVAPLYYQTAAFRLAMMLLVASLAFGLYRFRIRLLMRRQAWLESEVEARTEELAVTNRTLEDRVQAGIDKLRQAERFAAYGEIVASVAHEVRQPLFAMQAAGYVISEKLASDSEVTSQLETLALETKRISTMMEDLLDFARPVELEQTYADVRPLVEEAVEIFIAENDGGGLSPAVEISEDIGEAWLDRTRIVQVLVNLLGNARRHAGPSASVQVSAQLDDTNSRPALRISISDDGPGFDPENLQTVFDPFVTSGKGTGIGLAIVQRIVEQHGGSVKASNLKPSARNLTGALISITLPLRPPIDPSPS